METSFIKYWRVTTVKRSVKKTLLHWLDYRIIVYVSGILTDLFVYIISFFSPGFSIRSTLGGMYSARKLRSGTCTGRSVRRRTSRTGHYASVPARIFWTGKIARCTRTPSHTAGYVWALCWKDTRACSTTTRVD